MGEELPTFLKGGGWGREMHFPSGAVAVHEAYKVDGVHVQTSVLVVEATGRRKRSRHIWRLTKPLYVCISYAGGELKFTVPEGTETDFASTPTFVQLVMGNRDDPGLLIAAVVHDAACQRSVYPPIANLLFLVLLIARDVRPWQRRAVFLAVWWFGYGSRWMRWVKWARVKWASMKRFLSRARQVGRKG